MLYEQLDEDFAEIERLFAAMNAVKAGYATYAEAEAAGEAEPEEEPSEEKKADPEIEKEIDEMMDEAAEAAKAEDSLDIDAD